MSSHILNLKFKLVLCTATSTLISGQCSMHKVLTDFVEPWKLDARESELCHLFCRFQLLNQHQSRLPQLMSAPMANALWRSFQRSVSRISSPRFLILLTVRPFDKVVDSVRAGVTGLAYLRNGAMALRALFVRAACRKLYASLWDAISEWRRKERSVLEATMKDGSSLIPEFVVPATKMELQLDEARELLSGRGYLKIWCYIRQVLRWIWLDVDWTCPSDHDDYNSTSWIDWHTKINTCQRLVLNAISWHSLLDSGHSIPLISGYSTLRFCINFKTSAHYWIALP